MSKLSKRTKKVIARTENLIEAIQNVELALDAMADRGLIGMGADAIILSHAVNHLYITDDLLTKVNCPTHPIMRDAIAAYRHYLALQTRSQFRLLETIKVS